VEFYYGLILGLIVGWVIEWIIDFVFWRRRNRGYIERITMLEADLRQAKAKADTAEAEGKAIVTKYANSDREISRLKAELEKSATHAANSDTEIEGLRSQIAQLKTVAPNRELELMIANLKNENARLLAALDQKDADFKVNMNLYSTEIGKLKTDSAKLEAELVNLHALISTKNNEIADLRVALESKEAELNAVPVLSTKGVNPELAEESAAKLANAELEINRLKLALDFRDKNLNAKFEEADAEIERLRGELAAKNAVLNANLEAQAECKAILEAKTGEFDRRLAESTAETGRLTTALDACHAELTANRQAESELHRLKAILESKDAEFKARFSQTDNEIGRLKLALEARESELAHNQAECAGKLNTARIEIDRLKAALELSSNPISAETAIANEADFSGITLKTTETGVPDLADETPPTADNLEVINGVSKNIEKQFYAGGIFTFAQLAELTPEQIREIIKPEDGQKIEPEEWIAVANDLVRQQNKSRKGDSPQEDDLEVIDGIGPVFEKRFYEAGIYTFKQLAELSPERIREIVKVKGWQKIEPEKWIAEAREYANDSLKEK
jgi:predicted flap endonuclease-1-like 5' DNA nuclease